MENETAPQRPQVLSHSPEPKWTGQSLPPIKQGKGTEAMLTAGTVLIGVLKDRRDLEILRKKSWYRIPLSRAPKKKADYLAFYEPGRAGRRGIIRYYAGVKSSETAKRIELIPEEPRHPMAGEDYLKIGLSQVKKLKKPVKNANGMRISFAFTSFRKLLSAGTVAELLGVNPLEDLTASGLKKRKTIFSREYIVSLKNGRRYRLDFAFFRKNGKLDVECDGEKWHSAKKQRFLDKRRDRILKRRGWKILRFGEKEITGDMDKCLDKITRKLKTFPSQSSAAPRAG